MNDEERQVVEYARACSRTPEGVIGICSDDLAILVRLIDRLQKRIESAVKPTAEGPPGQWSVFAHDLGGEG